MSACNISLNEAFWRIYKYHIHSRKPPVQILPCHLPDEHLIKYEEGQEQISAARGVPQTKLMDFFLLNQRDLDARTILYPDLPNTARQTLHVEQRRTEMAKMKTWAIG